MNTKIHSLLMALLVGLITLTTAGNSDAKLTSRFSLTQTTTSTSLPDYSDLWESFSLPEKQKAAEQIGEKGAEQWAKKQGWKQILGPEDKSIPQGFDMVFEDKQGKLHVIEAKGGNSPLATYDGFKQGTSESTIKEAERILKSPKTSEYEKAVARRVLEESITGTVETHPVRTPHESGKPMVPIEIAPPSKPTAKSRELAKEVHRDLVETTSPQTDATRRTLRPARRGTPQMERPFFSRRTTPSSSKPPGTSARSYPRTLPRVGTFVARGATLTTGEILSHVTIIGAGVIDIGFGAYGIYDTERRFRLGELDSDIRMAKLIVGGAQISVGMATIAGGIVLFCLSPEPILTKIVGGALIVTGIILVAIDYVLERIQTRRTAERLRIIEGIDRKEQYTFVYDKLRVMINQPL